MEKKDEKKTTVVPTILYGGEECITLKTALQMTGMTRPTFKTRIKRYGIKEFVTESKCNFYRKSDIEQAIENGWFNKWYM